MIRRKSFVKMFLSVMAFGMILCPGNPVKAAEKTVSVVSYGAVADDGNNDAVAIQMALNEAIGSSEMVTVTIPAGTYHLDRALKIYSNTYLKLDSNTVIYRMKSAYDKNMLHAVDQSGKMDQVGGYDMFHDITVDGGTWDGGDVANVSVGTDSLRFDHGKNLTIKNCKMKNVYDCHLLELVGVQNAEVLNCEFSGFYYNTKHKNQREYGREAVQIESAWTNNPSNLNDVNAQWAKGVVIDGTHCENILVSDCVFIDFPVCVGQHHYSSASSYSNTKNVTIRNNTITAGPQYTYFKTAIPCGGMDQVVISGNTISGPYLYGINAFYSKDVSISGNTIKSSQHNAICVENATVTDISKNKISSIKKHGISIQKSTVGKKNKSTTGIRSNSISSCKQNGICVSGGGKVYYITGNKINKSGKHGISTVEKNVIGDNKYKNSGICKNKITNSNANGICISAGTTSYISQNTIKNSKNNGISIVGGKVYLVSKNQINKARIGIYAKSSKMMKKKAAGNKISKCKWKTVGV